MVLKLITYDLNSPGQDYEALHKRIKALGPYLHMLESTWLVDTGLSCDQVCDAVRGRADANDNLFVVDITGDPRQGWLPSAMWDWMRQHS